MMMMTMMTVMTMTLMLKPTHSAARRGLKNTREAQSCKLPTEFRQAAVILPTEKITCAQNFNLPFQFPDNWAMP